MSPVRKITGELQRMLREQPQLVRAVVTGLKPVLMSQAPVFSTVFDQHAVLIDDGTGTVVVTPETIMYGTPAVTNEGINLDAVDPDDQRVAAVFWAMSLVVQTVYHLDTLAGYDGNAYVELHHTLELKLRKPITREVLAQDNIYLPLPLYWRPLVLTQS